MEIGCDNVLLLFVFTISLTILTADDSCKTPNGNAGKCINIRQCPDLLNMLRDQRQVPGVADFLRASACGYDGRDPKVCCQDSSSTSSQSEKPNKPSVTLPDLSVCGVTPTDLDERRIVGGFPAQLGAWPWMTELGYKTGSDVKFLCGGTLITAHHVVTAGHCVYNRKDLYIARVGDLDLKKDDDGAKPEEILITDRHIHEQYNPTTFVNDIAVLKLEKDVTFTTLIRPICLPLAPELRKRDFVRHYPYLAGWGATEFNGPSSEHLMQLQIPVVSQSSCKDAFKRFNTAVIDERVLCAGYQKGGKDACQGDSGGPLMWPSGENFYLIGVVSYGYRCAEPGIPGVYTRVTKFVDWITDHLT